MSEEDVLEEATDENEDKIDAVSDGQNSKAGSVDESLHIYSSMAEGKVN